MVYLTVVPVPSSPGTTADTVSSPGIHITVNPVPRTNPAGVLPVAVLMPLALLALGWFVRKRWRPGGNAGMMAG